MKFKKTYKALSLLLAFLLLSTSSGFSIDLHFCQGQLKSLSLIGNAKNCHEMASNQNHCKHHQTLKTDDAPRCQEDKDDCCNNDKLHFQMDEDKILSNVQFELSNTNIQFIVAFVCATIFNLNFQFDNCQTEFYTPPLIPKHIAVLFQTFLL